MLKWLFARNDVIIEKAMAHILRTGQAFDLRFFCSLLNREYCRNILLPENRFWPFQFPFKKDPQSFNSVMLYSTRSDHKAAFAESVIRTIRATLVRSMEDNGPNWIDQINQIVHNYNESYHSVIKMTPSEGERKFPEALTNILNTRKSLEPSGMLSHCIR